MSKIEFRGKRVDNREWVYGTVEFHLVDGDLTKIKRDAFITFDSMDKIGKVYRDRYEVDPATVGQCTGIPDKNGAEVFGGDIILATYDIGDGCDPRGLREKTIILDTWEAFIEFIFDVGHDAYIEIEVIGNIHDNPELIESEDR